MIVLDPQIGIPGTHSVDVRSLRRFLPRAMDAVPIRGEISILLTSDSEIRRLNRSFRGKNKATDVLSFPVAAGLPEGIAGDLAISLDTAARQAERFGHSLQTELKILLLHGLLHLAGYDHETDGGEMAAREEILRQQFRLPVALIARGAGTASGTPVSRSRGGRR